jgi:hypothetical protein
MELRSGSATEIGFAASRISARRVVRNAPGYRAKWGRAMASQR